MAEGPATTPESATRYIETSRGRLSYLELAPLLADRIAIVETRIASDGYADAPLDEYLILRLQGDIVAELVPALGGRWRQKDVTVGSHNPPPFPRVPELMREYARDLAARTANLGDDYPRLLEALAFAEGRLLSIHPFEDFNGRLTRVFLSELLRRLNLPAIDPTPELGPPTKRYLEALAAGDRRDWRPLMTIWRERLEADDYFTSSFLALTGHKPMPWQSRLFRTYFLSGDMPPAVSIPTGLGKTAVIAVWLIALAWQCRESKALNLPRRLVYVVDRRAVVDQSTTFAEKLRERLATPAADELRAALGFTGDQKLAISTLRGQFVDNREWLEDPSRPAIIVGTVDMIGSRLLFEGYGVSRKMRPYHAGLIGADALVMLDEAHLVPPFEALLASIAGEPSAYSPRADEDRKCVPAFKLLPLSATSRSSGESVFSLEEQDYNDPEDEGAILTRKRLGAVKHLRIETAGAKDLPKAVADQAWELAEKGRSTNRCLVYCNSRNDAEKVYDDLLGRLIKLKKSQMKKANDEDVRAAARQQIELFVGARRVHERVEAAARLDALGFLADSAAEHSSACFLVATSAGEVGVDLDADHLVCDLVPWERMVQRFGRVNRRGTGTAQIIAFAEAEPEPTESLKKALDKAAEERSKKENDTIESHQKEIEGIRALRKPFGEVLIATSEGVFDVSPGALRELATKEQVRALLSAASTPAPLRPALTRPLVDAWSMTSLEEHTGRPHVEPWLRGWVSDKPQTAVAWRTHLPVRAEPVPKKSEINDFFEAAPLHALELLETETYRVLNWLMKRVKELLGPRTRSAPVGLVEEGEDAPEEGTQDVATESEPIEAAEPSPGNGLDTPKDAACPTLKPDDVIGMIFSPGGDYERTLLARDVPVESQKSDSEAQKKRAKEAKDKMHDELAGSTLVLAACLGGLNNGLLNAETNIRAGTADGDTSWGSDEKGKPLIPFRIRDSQAIDAPVDGNWRESLRFDLDRNADGEATRWLVIEECPDSANTEDFRSSGPDQTLTEHQSWAERCARAIGERLGLPDNHVEMLAIAARLHDEGKQAKNWQDAFRAPAKDRPYAKTRGPIIFSLLDGYRHEFGSLPYAQKDDAFNKLPKELQELALHLIAAHHGFARPVIGISGCADAPPSVLEARAREVALRFAWLQRRWGPWGLAWWEALLRAADRQASRENDEQGRKRPKGKG